MFLSLQCYLTYTPKKEFLNDSRVWVNIFFKQGVVSYHWNPNRKRHLFYILGSYLPPLPLPNLNNSKTAHVHTQHPLLSPVPSSTLTSLAYASSGGSLLRYNTRLGFIWVDMWIHNTTDTGEQEIHILCTKLQSMMWKLCSRLSLWGWSFALCFMQKQNIWWIYNGDTATIFQAVNRWRKYNWVVL
jgi:hypothetical protein